MDDARVRLLGSGQYAICGIMVLKSFDPGIGEGYPSEEV